MELPSPASGELELLEYVPERDFTQCLDLMQGNIPRYFLAEDLSDFEQWLMTRKCPFFVCWLGNEIVGCGGYSLTPNATGRLRRGMVRQSCHREGLGSYLLCVRIARMRSEGVRDLYVDTSQHSEGFFLRHGFRVISRLQNGYGPGHDRVELHLHLPDRAGHSIDSPMLDEAWLRRANAKPARLRPGMHHREP